MDFIKKAESLKKDLKKRTVLPCATLDFVEDKTAFQGLSVKKTGECSFPIRLVSGERVILDFGEHCVGYLSLDIACLDGVISDSPVRLKFSFGEFPLEIVKREEEYRGLLGNGWIQREEKNFPFTPCTAFLERRYAFRYLLIERTDSASFPIEIKSISAECVSSVSLESAPLFETGNAALDRIYKMSLKTLRDCEQDVFEDGPKRDRRLWIGDLRLQALVDYKTFKNLDLIKRCIYLFAGYLNSKNEVVPCVYPDSPPHRLEWTFADYSLFLTSCLYDYYKAVSDKDFVEGIYPTAYLQIRIIAKRIEENFDSVSENTFVDWCTGLDKRPSLLGIYIYVLNQAKSLALLLEKDTDFIDAEREKAERRLREYLCDGLFVAPSGQISHHSQVWGVLSGILSEDEGRALLERLDVLDVEHTMRTPYMIHYYIEALVKCNMRSRALEKIADIWGKIADAGFDCCPEIFNPQNEFESPYDAPEINSACHAWSCTPAYWIKVLEEK